MRASVFAVCDDDVTVRSTARVSGALDVKPSDWIALTAVFATVITALLGLLYSYFTQRRQQNRDDEQHALQLKREDEIRLEQRIPHLELSLGCRVLGEQMNDYLVEFVLTASNHGFVRWKFTNIRLRVRGIQANQPLLYWAEQKPRLYFPVKIFDVANVIPSDLNYLFVDPGIRQDITYVTKIPSTFTYLLSYVEFWYDETTPHSVERAFSLDAARSASSPGPG